MDGGTGRERMEISKGGDFIKNLSERILRMTQKSLIINLLLYYSFLFYI